MQEQIPLATVIVPSYNSPDLYAALNSVIGQDYPRIQLILVDDASDVFSPKDAEQYILLRNRGNLESVIVLENRENLGTVRTMNRALQYCNGEYQFNLAGDDCFYDSSVLSDWIAEFERTGANILTARRAIFDERLEQEIRMEPTAEQIGMIQSKTPRELFEILTAANFIFGCCTARRTAVIRLYGLYDEHCRLIEDHPMNLKMLRMGEPIGFFDRIVVKYRGGGTSSPQRYSEVYRQDVETILRCEILPYTKHPLRARRDNWVWRREQRLLRQRAMLMERWKGCWPAECLAQFLFYAQRPWQTLCGGIRRIQKRIKGEG